MALQRTRGRTLTRMKRDSSRRRTRGVAVEEKRRFREREPSVSGLCGFDGVCLMKVQPLAPKQIDTHQGREHANQTLFVESGERVEARREARALEKRPSRPASCTGCAWRIPSLAEVIRMRLRGRHCPERRPRIVNLRWVRPGGRSLWLRKTGAATGESWYSRSLAAKPGRLICE